MATVLSTLLRGMVGVAASVLVVVIVWTLYVQRESVARVTTPLAGLVKPRGEEPAPPPGAPGKGNARGETRAAAPAPGAARDADVAQPARGHAAARGTTPQAATGGAAVQDDAAPDTDGAPTQ